MSYQALARKWRPRQFSQVVGQEHVLSALSNALTQGRLHHAYLFSGTRGVGKTTLARLFAKSLNCEQGISAEPCGQCQSCVELDEGRFVDLIEIDAASRTKVEDTRELLDNVQYRPTRGRFKIYLIDEVHMLSRHSFNALLKTLEEPPEHVKFLLATTDPKKLPVTVLSRCLQLTLKHHSVEQISGQLANVLQQEAIGSQPAALTALARAAAGSMRDALSLTDQAIAHGGGQVLAEQVNQMLGTVAQGQVAELLTCLVNDDLPAMFQQLDQLSLVDSQGYSVLDELALLLHHISLVQLVPERAGLIDSDVSAEHMAQFAESINAETLQLWYQIALKSKADLALAPDTKAGLEMVMLRLVAFNPEKPLPPKSRAVSNTPALSAAPVPGQAQSAPASQPQRVQTITQQMHDEQAQLMSEAEAHGISGYGVAQVPPEYEPIPIPGTQPVSAPPVMPVQAGAAQGGPAQGAPAAMDTMAQVRAAREQLRQRRQRQQPAATQTEQNGEQGGATSIKKSPRPATPGSEPAQQSGTQRPVKRQPAARPISTRVEAPAFTKQQPQAVWGEHNWPQIIEKLPLGGLLRQMAVNCALVQTEPKWQLVLKPEQKHLLNDNSRQQLNEQLSELLQQPVELEISLGESDIEVPLETRQRLGHEAWLKARESLHNEDVVQAMMQIFGAQLDDASIEPLKQPQLLH